MSRVVSLSTAAAGPLSVSVATLPSEIMTKKEGKKTKELVRQQTKNEQQEDNRKSVKQGKFLNASSCRDSRPLDMELFDHGWINGQTRTSRV
mmetsp:Transcript_64466/g.74028  ORF Transcript_64466/g.74028 Transcript_64466/m.74028 type:complete len:92 (+) Transcript_64466:353-628(+)